jgi:hypothetical protein
MHLRWGLKQRARAKSAWLMAAITAVLAGCAGNGEGLDENGRPADGSSAPLQATFESIQENVFTPICTQCHSGAQAPVGLRLDAASSYAMLVNTPSAEVPTLSRVEPGNPDMSYLVQKIQGTAAVGGRMPLNSPALPQATIDIIKEWIANGAPPASTSGVSGKPTIHAVSPQPDEKWMTPPRELLLEASTELDLTRLTAENVSLMRSGGDSRFDDGNEALVPILGIEARSTTPTVIAIAVSPEVWVADQYRLSVRGESAAPVMDLAGQALDGNADGISGDDYVLQFDLEGAQ